MGRKPRKRQRMGRRGKGKEPQLGFVFRIRGGRREGAGRPRKKGTISHAKRPKLSRHHPVHVSIRLVHGLRRSLRTHRLYRIVRRVLVAAAKRYTEFRIVEYSVQDNHLHLIGEAESERWLSRGMQGFNIRLAKAINGALGREKGQVIRHRYSSKILTTPLQIKNSLLYVLHNGRRHAVDMECFRSGWVDPYSSAVRFKGWDAPIAAEHRRAIERGVGPPAELPAAKSWLLETGWWEKQGLLDLHAFPAAKPVFIHTA